MDIEKDKRVWKSFVWHDGKCFFVSTIERTFDTYAGFTQGDETLVWEYDYERKERIDLIHQGGGVAEHQMICRCLIAEGECPNEDNPQHARFFK